MLIAIYATLCRVLLPLVHLTRFAMISPLVARKGTGHPSLLLVELTPEIDPPLVLIAACRSSRPKH